MLAYYSDWSEITLITPVEDYRNIMFYTEKCGFKICGTEMDGNVKVYDFILKR